jgi:hypothetical protein
MDIAYEVAFVKNVLSGFRAFHHVKPCDIKKPSSFQKTTTADNGDPLFQR